MPLYIYVHPETEELIEIRQRMKDAHAYIDEHGVEWSRVFTPPKVSTDANMDAFSSRQFVDKTHKKSDNSTVGDLYDMAKEASEKRKQKLGYDPIQQKFFKDYSKKRKGRRHPNDPSK